MYYLASSVVVVVGVEDRPPFGDLAQKRSAYENDRHEKGVKGC